MQQEPGLGVDTSVEGVDVAVGDVRPVAGAHRALGEPRPDPAQCEDVEVGSSQGRRKQPGGAGGQVGDGSQGVASALVVDEPGCEQRVEGSPEQIGVLAAITGPSSSLGVPERNTVQMLVDQINAKGGVKGPDGKTHPLQAVIYDTKSDNTEALVAAKKLIDEDKVSVIIGPTLTGESLAIVDAVTKAEIPLISMAAGIKIVEPVADRKWIFKTPQSDRLVLQAIADHLKQGNLDKVAGQIGNRCMVVPTIHGLTVDGVGNQGKNRVVAEFAASRPGTQTPDWAGAVAEHPELMQPDDLHPIAEGADYRAQLIVEGVEACLGQSGSF